MQLFIARSPSRPSTGREKRDTRAAMLCVYVERNIQAHAAQSAAAPSNAITRPASERGWHLIFFIFKLRQKIPAQEAGSAKF